MPLAQLQMDENVLLRDYLLLEEVARHAADTSTRDPKLRSSLQRVNWPPRVKLLWREAKKRGVFLRVMPPGMKRHDQNTSTFVAK